MTPTEDLDRLLSAAVDGELSADDQLHLAVLLRDDPTAQAAYLDYIFLESLLRWEKSQPVPATPVNPVLPRRAFRPAGWLLAACLLVGVAVGLFVAPTREVAAKSDVLEQLADWNLAVANASAPADRRERYREQADAFRGELTRASLPVNERELADALFESAGMLADSDNSLTTAEQLDATSEKILEWISANADGDPKRAQAMELRYHRIVERSLGALRDVKAIEMPDAVDAKHFEQLTERIARRANRHAAKLAERAAKKAGR